MAVTQVGDILVLENNEMFQVMEILDFNDETYLYAIQAPEEWVEAIDHKNIKQAFLKEIVDAETEEVFVEQVKDIELIKNLQEELLIEIGEDN